MLKAQFGRCEYSDIAFAITTRIDASGASFLIEETDKEMNEEIKTKVALTLNEGKWQNMHEQSRRVFDTEGIAPTVHTAGGGGQEIKVLGWSRDSQGKVVNRHPVDVANAVTSAKRDNTQNFVLENRFLIRKLTERECFRLMGVDDEDIDKIQSAGISKTQQYKMSGNSIVVDVFAAIFDRLLINKTPEAFTQLELF